MKRISMCLAVLALAAFAATAQANLLTDGSFEDLNASGAWTTTDNVPDGANGSLEISTSVWAASDGDTGVWFKPFEGMQDPGEAAASASISQSIIAPTNGDYTLFFDSARETNTTASSFPASLSSSGTGGSATIELLTATYNDDGNMASDPTRFSLGLTGVTAGDTLTVSVAMVDGVDSLMNPQSLMVDNFILVPEPASVALTGMALLGMLAMRRKR